MADEGEDERPTPETFISQHPVYQTMLSLQSGDSAQVHAAFLVYLDLVEVRQWRDVTTRGSLQLQLVLLQGKPPEGDITHLVLPLPAHRSLSHQGIRGVLAEGFPMLLCVVASDSSLVYQRLSSGLLIPEPPTDEQEQQRKRRKRRLR